MTAIIPSRPQGSLPDVLDSLPDPAGPEDMLMSDVPSFPSELQAYLPRLLDEWTALLPGSMSRAQAADTPAGETVTQTAPASSVSSDQVSRFGIATSHKSDNEQRDEPGVSKTVLSRVSTQPAGLPSLPRTPAPELAPYAPTSSRPGALKHLDPKHRPARWEPVRPDMPAESKAASVEPKRAPVPFSIASDRTAVPSPGAAIERHVITERAASMREPLSTTQPEQSRGVVGSTNIAVSPSVALPSQSFAEVDTPPASRSDAPAAMPRQKLLERGVEQVAPIQVMKQPGHSPAASPSDGQHHSRPRLLVPVHLPAPQTDAAYLRLPFTHNGLLGNVEIHRQVTDATVQLQISASHAEINRHLASQLDRVNEPSWRMVDADDSNHQGRQRGAGQPEPDDEPDGSRRGRR